MGGPRSREGKTMDYVVKKEGEILRNKKWCCWGGRNMGCKKQETTWLLQTELKKKGERERRERKWETAKRYWMKCA